eukprot:TRINITY_DN2186_c1_g1_i1.p1 TRINITY_DN2186_c1_g1~~TRINITY_DN2186_c1_g1_i1.p1  ORF type:complete len:113 (+),score=43.69 TRINITY_DN2186_c1_g1_i1:87-425(+)
MASVKDLFQAIEDGIKSKGAELVKMGNAVFQLLVSDGGDDGKLLIDLKNGSGSCKRGEGKADVTITMAGADFLAMAAGKLDGMQAFMGGKLKIKGNMMLAQKLGPILDSVKN